jgi:biopolymer transport protein ExbB
MKNNTMKKGAMKYRIHAVGLSVLLAMSAVTLAVTVQASAQTAQAQITDLDQLLAKVKAEHEKERSLNRQREAEFLKARDQQQQLLEKARAAFYLAQAKNNPAKMQAEINDAEIARMRKELQQSVSEMGDIYSIYRQFSADFSAVLGESQIGAQFPDRAQELQQLNKIDALPVIDDMERLWFLVQQEMTESGKISAYDGKIVAATGASRDAKILRIGNLGAFANGDFLRYVPETSEFVAPAKQPERHFIRMAETFAVSEGEITAVPVDPTRGSLLGMLARTPDMRERIEQGGTVGYITIAVGIVGLLIAFYRTFYLLLVRARVLKQMQHSEKPSANNPLGRIILSVQSVAADDEETIQYKLDEAILQEVPRLEYGHTIIKLFAAVAPMLGLLGTVTGMIRTFEAISLFGGGDPKLMAAGISEALVCTVLGLIVAVPMLFGHNVVTALAKAVLQRLDEQSAGILARNMEKSRFARK